jgi:hypothetical protein
MPAAQPIIADRTHAGGQGREPCPLPSRHDRQEMFGDECWSDGIDRVGRGEPGGIEFAQRLFWPALVVEAHTLAAERLHGDDTAVPMMAKGKTITGRLWEIDLQLSSIIHATVAAIIPSATWRIGSGFSR